MKILVLGGTQFVSWYLVKRFVEDGYEVTTLNRGSKKGFNGNEVIELYADRHNLIELKGVIEDKKFDYVVDVSAYTKEDVEYIYESLNKDNLKGYIFISSSAVYKENETLPIKEEFEVGTNKYWGNYGLNKLKAEEFIRSKIEEEKFPATILRPPYIYGEGNNVYRESFIFDRLKDGKDILVPNDGLKKLHFIHIEDLYTIVKEIIDKNIFYKIFNVGNKVAVTIEEWIVECMRTFGVETKVIHFNYKDYNYKDRDFFPFYDYQYFLDTTQVRTIIEPKISLQDGLKRALDWYKSNEDKVDKRAHYDKNCDEILLKLN